MAGLILVVLLLALYFAPTFVAFGRSHPHAASILILNLFLGWTFVGWVVALAMSVSGFQQRRT
ncbi:MAG: superinfection immunity protein [Dehalococcoidia bacterium]|jgi:hypothetical protein